MRRFLPLFFLTLTWPLAAQEFGQIPYATVDQNIERIAGNDPSKVAARLRVSSRNGVKLSDVTLTIKAKPDAVRLAVAADGGVTDFPRTEALRKENPPVVTNQPKGSIDLNVEVGLPVPMELSFPYQRLVDGAREISARVAVRPLTSSGAEAAALTKLKFIFDDPTATISTPGKDGTVTTKVGANGEAVLEIQPEFAKGDAKVTFSARPRWITIAK